MPRKPTSEGLRQRKKVVEETAAGPKRMEAFGGSEGTWLAVLKSVPNFIIFADRDGTIQYVNRTVSGMTVEEAMGKNINDFEQPEYHNLSGNAIKQAFRYGRTGSYDVRGLGPDSSTSWYQIHYGPLKHDGKVVFVTFIITDITERKRAEEALLKAHEGMESRIKERTAELLATNEQLRAKEMELQEQARRIEEANTALKVLLEHKEREKSEIEEKLLSNVKKLVMPFVDKLKSTKIDATQEAYLKVVESHLEEILSPFSLRLSSGFVDFTPKEIQVADLIKDGKTNKEIADLLTVSRKAIEFHRENIRRKLGLKHKKINLQSYLSGLL